MNVKLFGITLDKRLSMMNIVFVCSVSLTIGSEHSRGIRY